jgi:hypothetical protein
LLPIEKLCILLDIEPWVLERMSFEEIVGKLEEKNINPATLIADIKELLNSPPRDWSSIIHRHG